MKTKPPFSFMSSIGKRVISLPCFEKSPQKSAQLNFSEFGKQLKLKFLIFICLAWCSKFL